MPKIRLKCSCGENITYFLDPEDLASEFQTKGVVAILIPHTDHFITVYVDKNYTVRGMERVVLVRDQNSSVVVKSSKNIDVDQIVGDLINKNDPSKRFIKFLSQVVDVIKAPEDLFVAGRKVGSYCWGKRRDPIIKMGANFTIDPELILKNEIVPIFDKIVKIEKIKGDNNSVMLKESISPQFIVGATQGILDAIQDYMKDSAMNIQIEFTMTGTTIFLTLKEAEMKN